MSRHRAAFVCGVVLIFVGACATGPRARVVSAKQLRTAGYYKYWEAQLPLRSRDEVRAAYLVDDNLYVTTRLGDLYCVSADQGLLRWSTTVSRPDYIIFPPTHVRVSGGGGPVVVVTTSRTFVFDRYSGEQLFAFAPDFAPGSAALGVGNRLYMGGANGRMYALLWKHRFNTGPLLQWQLLTGGPVLATPVLYGEDQLVFATEKGAVVSCGAHDKNALWVARTEAAVLADPYVDETGVYVASTDRSLYRFDVSNGTMIWRHRFPKPLVDAPVVARQTCFQFCPETGLTAIDIDTGDTRWVRPDGASFVASGFGQTVIATESGRIDVVDPDTGETIRGFDAADSSVVIPNARDDRVFLLSPDGHVTCARPESVPYLKLQQVRAAERMLTQPPIPRGGANPAMPAAPPPSSADEPDIFRSTHD